MKIREIIVETIDISSAYPITSYGVKRGHWKAYAWDSNNRYIETTIIPYEKTNAYVEFRRGGRLDVTGQGDALKVLATVISAVKLFLEENPNPEKLIFSADEPSRQKLYRRMIKKIAPTLGYEVDADRGHVFQLKRKEEEAITESENSHVEELKKELLTAKKHGDKLDYDAIDGMMKRISRKAKITPDKLHDMFVNSEGDIPDDWIKNQKVKATMAEQDITESLTNLSTIDKIVFLEEYVTRNGMISESNSESSKKQFHSLLDSTTEPIIGKKYIVLPLMLVSDRIMSFDAPIIGKFMGETKDNSLKFIDTSTDQDKIFPPKITKRVKSITETFVFDSVNNYDQFGTILTLTWDFQLPELDLSEAKELKKQDIDEESPKYLGPKDKVKINKRGWQIPLNKRGFGV